MSTAATALLGLLLAACGGGGSKVAATAGQPAAATAAVTVDRISNPKLGSILANSKGEVLYTYTADKAGKIACTGACLTYWPPLLLPPSAKEAVAGPGVSGLGTVSRPEGVQVTYHGQPLYTYVSDTQQNPIAGEDVADNGGKWLAVVISPTSPTTPKPAATTPTTVVTTAPATVAPVVTVPVTNPPPTMPRATTPPPPPPTTPRAAIPPPPPPTTPRTTPPTAPPTTVPPGGPSY